VKIRPVLADTGRLAAGSAVNLLNAGWTHTTGVPLPSGGWTLPQQALTIFLDAPWEQLNQLHDLIIELVSDDGVPAYFGPGPSAGGSAARLHHRVVIAPVAGAPMGTPGFASVFMDIPAGTLWIPSPGRRYAWRITSGGVTEEIGFWVQNPPQLPVIGGPAPSAASQPPTS
jgi:hypothetical protein